MDAYRSYRLRKNKDHHQIACPFELRWNPVSELRWPFHFNSSIARRSGVCSLVTWNESQILDNAPPVWLVKATSHSPPPPKKLLAGTWKSRFWKTTSSQPNHNSWGTHSKNTDPKTWHYPLAMHTSLIESFHWSGSNRGFLGSMGKLQGSAPEKQGPVYSAYHFSDSWRKSNFNDITALQQATSSQPYPEPRTKRPAAAQNKHIVLRNNLDLFQMPGNKRFPLFDKRWLNAIVNT